MEQLTQKLRTGVTNLTEVPASEPKMGDILARNSMFMYFAWDRIEYCEDCRPVLSLIYISLSCRSD
jgi:hypothetical protein